MANPRLTNAKKVKNDNGKIVEDWWTGISRPYGKEVVNYPTQKSLALLQRIIEASSNEGDTILEPFGGSGTATVYASQHNRNYIWMDISKKALAITKKRIVKLLLHPQHCNVYHPYTPYK